MAQDDDNDQTEQGASASSAESSRTRKTSAKKTSTNKASAKKTSANKAAVKNAATKKAATKKAATKKAPAERATKKTASSEPGSGPSEKTTASATPEPGAPRGEEDPASEQAGSTVGRRPASATAEAPRRRGASAIAREAASQLFELTGHEIEGITAVHREDDGWLVEIDVLELRRIPATTDVLATYEVQVDDDGDLVGYSRRHRFVRGSVSEGR